MKPDLQPYFNKSLGKFVKSRAHVKELVYERGRELAEAQPWRDTDHSIEEM